MANGIAGDLKVAEIGRKIDSEPCPLGARASSRHRDALRSTTTSGTCRDRRPECDEGSDSSPPATSGGDHRLRGVESRLLATMCVAPRHSCLDVCPLDRSFLPTPVIAHATNDGRVAMSDESDDPAVTDLRARDSRTGVYNDINSLATTRAVLG